MCRSERYQWSAVAAGLAALLSAAPICAFPLFEPDRGPQESLTGIYEYYNAERDQYFVTASNEEVAALDSGRFVGWKRAGSGHAFLVFTDPVKLRNVASGDATARAVCRYYIPPTSHFLSASEEECNAVAQAHPEFELETSAAFYAWVPDRVSGLCPRLFAKIGGFDLQPVYRLWNNRADTNHRLTTSKSERLLMIDHGWVSEGYGDEGVAMCVPRWYF